MRILLSILLSLGIVACGKKETPEERFQSSVTRAEEFVKAEKWDEARISLMNAIEAKGDNPKSHYDLAEVFMRLKKIGPAIDQYETTLNLDPDFRDARLKIAAIKLGGNQIEAAESDVQKLLDKNPEDLEALLLQGAIAKIKNKLPLAKEILAKVLAKDPNNNLAFAALGDVTLAEGKIQEAEELFNKSLAIEPNNASVRLALADLYVKQNRLDDAQGIIQSLLDKDPKNSSLRFYLGEFLLARGSGEKATEQYRELLKVDAKRHDARDRLYDLLVLKKEFANAKALTAELAAIEPNEPGTLFFKGRDLEVDGKFQDAYSLYLKAVEGLPGFAPLFRHTGMMELNLGKIQEAVEHLNQAVAINPADVGSRLALARHYFVTRDFALAKEHSGAVLKLFPRQIGANLIRADISLIEGDTVTAEAIYKALEQAMPDNPISYFKLAALEETKKNAPAAIAYYEKGLSFDRDVLVPAQRVAQLSAGTLGVDKALEKLKALRDKSNNNKPDYDVLIGTMLMMASKKDPAKLKEAREYLTSAVERKPDLLSGYFTLAQLDAVEGKAAEAESNYQRILAKQPKHVPSRMLLAMSLEARGALDQALAEYRKILEVSPGFGAALNNIAWIIVSSGKGTLDEALEAALKAKEKMPTVASVADTLGWIYFKKDAAKAALPVLEEAVEIERRNAPTAADGRKILNPEILYHLAVVQDSLGLKAEAKKSAQEALAAGGERAPFATELKKIAEGS